MDIYANPEKARYLKQRLACYEETDLVLVQLDIPKTQGTTEEQIQRVLDAERAGHPILVLSLVPISDYKRLLGYEEMIAENKRKMLLDGHTQHQALEKAVQAVLDG